ncbi:MAG: MinD/ParA family protein [Verrucomicrobia bacterium]|nr:MinD/ParA family protein [Verrucomicrobiota bacterium]
MSPDTTKLLIADGTGTTADAVASFLKGDPSFELIGRVTTGEECLNAALLKRPDLVIIHSDLTQAPAIEVCEQLAQQNPDIGILMVLSAGFDEQLFQRMMGAGVTGFLFCPLQKDRTLEAIRSAVEKTERRSSVAAASVPEEDRRRVICVVGPRGGGGRTTVAVNLSCAIAKATTAGEKNNRVVLVDANVPGGDAAMFLDMNPRRTLADISPQTTVVDQVLVESLLQNHASGVALLVAANSETSERPELPRGVLLHVLTYLRRQFPFTVVDMPDAATEACRAVLDFSDDVLLVIGVDLPRLEAARVFLARLLESNFARGKIRAVLSDKNPYSKNIGTAEAERILDFPVAARLPCDMQAASAAINLGEPFVLRQPERPISRAIYDLAWALGVVEKPRESSLSGSLAALFRTAGFLKTAKLDRVHPRRTATVGR